MGRDNIEIPQAPLQHVIKEYRRPATVTKCSGGDLGRYVRHQSRGRAHLCLQGRRRLTVVLSCMPPLCHHSIINARAARIRGEASDVIRIVIGERSGVRWNGALRLSFDYGRLAPRWISEEDREAVAVRLG